MRKKEIKELIEEKDQLEKMVKDLTKGKTELLRELEEQRDVSRDLYARLIISEEHSYKQFVPTRIISSKNTTVVWFKNGQKRIVKRAKGARGDVYDAVAYAIVLEMFKNNSRFKKAVDKVTQDNKEKHGAVQLTLF